jgi:PAS domain S-box-containing protein
MPQLRQLAPQVAIIVATGTVGLNAAIAALRFGAADFILKPIDVEALRTSLARIHERRQLEWAKERSEAAFRTLVEAAPCMIVILSPEHRILYFSRFAEQLTGYKAEAILGKDYFSIFLPPEWHRTVAEDIERVLSGTPTRGFENPVNKKDGTRLSMIWNADRLPDYQEGPAVLVVDRNPASIEPCQADIVHLFPALAGRSPGDPRAKCQSDSGTTGRGVFTESLQSKKTSGD